MNTEQSSFMINTNSPTEDIRVCYEIDQTKSGIYQIDVLDGLRQLKDESIDVIITSPPYNKYGLSKYRGHDGILWNATINYDGDINVDNLDEDVYKDWQTEVLNECYRVLKKDGSMFYNHKNRIVYGQGYISSPYEWITRTPFLVRQEIIWDRGSTNVVNPVRFLPTTEKIFWLTKDIHPSFKRPKDIKYKDEVWKFRFGRSTKHPAPFPLDLPNNILDCIPNIEDKVVLDPFMGSGTTAVAAKMHNAQYIGFELFQNYVDMANERLNSLN